MIRAPGDDVCRADVLERDLRWRPTDALRRVGRDLAAISEAEAIRIIDDRLARASHGDG